MGGIVLEIVEGPDAGRHLPLAFVTVGGGLGSFAMVDILRTAGVQSGQTRALTMLGYPWQTYEYLTEASELPVGERLRSDACPKAADIAERRLLADLLEQWPRWMRSRQP